MNDFTKEELETLWNCVDLYTDHKEHPYEELLNKITTLIDNYDSLDSIRDRTDLHGGLNRR